MSGISVPAKRPLARAKRDARDAILAAAMKLISKSGGKKDVSVREIAAEAGVNLALVSYYFDGKEGCLAELYRAKMVPSARERTDALRKLSAGAGVEAVLTEWLAPMLDLHDHWEFAERHVLMTFMQTHQPSLGGRLFCEIFDVPNSAFADAVLQRLPFLSRATVIWRLCALAGAAQIYRDEMYQNAMLTLSNRTCQAKDHREQFRQLIAFGVAGFSAGEPAAPARLAQKKRKLRPSLVSASGGGSS
jgi:AcrR family transcriptional regulator